MNLHVTNQDHVQGPADAPVELIEYADYQCPYCKKAFYIVKDIQQKMGDKLKFVFRNFPLTDVHQYAVHAALAAEAASGQDKFWEMHDILLENQRELDDAHLIEYAREIGLDVHLFEKDFGKDEYFQKVKSDYESGEKNGVEGTPTFFVNGQRFEGNWMSNELIEYLESLLK
ncbi:DsbA family protein [Parabacteroides sp. AM08-6]|uniref:DsbA family protein n=1 Tax=Parabacteroides sp. AM08-6 TaxID=2292053 RepID=UPI000EFE6D97|nr:DsbA family protein [Parabacteroides sp. AM08-6]RHJ82908.1 DsbA family protein [Parabacteroides sp. AM08-6]